MEIPRKEYPLYNKQKCPHCSIGRGILDGGEWICNHCGVLLPEAPEEYVSSQPYYVKIASADTDTPLEYRSTKDKPVVFIEQAYGRSTKVTKKKRELKVPIVDPNAVRIRNIQANMVKNAIDDLCGELGLQSEKVLNRFVILLKKVPINDMLKTDNIITNKRHKRASNVVAAGLIYKVYRNKVTVRNLKAAAKCGNKSLQKMLRLVT
jgi:transcription initiation factor TFIIIB Brf1 subunit/transcription initiation factor TFIIB